MPHPAIDYAETVVGVHTVWQEAQQCQERLDTATNTAVGAQAKRRFLDEQIENREMDLLIEERGKHPDHTEAAFTRHLKVVQHSDEELKRLKAERSAVAMAAIGADSAVDHERAVLRMLSARMEQQGGYFAYLAACKNAEASMPPSPAPTA